MNSPAMKARVLTLDHDLSALVPQETTLLSYDEHWLSLDGQDVRGDRRLVDAAAPDGGRRLAGEELPARVTRVSES